MKNFLFVPFVKSIWRIKAQNHFGGFCLLVDDAIVGLVLDGGFYLRGCLVARSHFESLGLTG